ncbi:PREDICTED: brain protein I3 [Myotis davidii]|uniref:brain protein I3 n=1 Tax=Myotis davidii TaxID=225400 RepID=UPI0007677F6D|nr:PREDICTED: brain protein I3 [Myotis davidii]
MTTVQAAGVDASTDPDYILMGIQSRSECGALVEALSEGSCCLDFGKERFLWRGRKGRAVLPAGFSCAFLSTGIPTHHPRVYNIHSRNVTRYPANSIVVVGGCPVCRVGVLEDSFTFLGILLAIVFFPFGFICCFALRKRRCPNCGANFT